MQGTVDAPIHIDDTVIKTSGGQPPSGMPVQVRKRRRSNHAPTPPSSRKGRKQNSEASKKKRDVKNVKRMVSYLKAASAPISPPTDQSMDDDATESDEVWVEGEEFYYEPGDECEVLRIIDDHRHGDDLFYLVHWLGYSIKDCTWEPESHLEGCDEILKAYAEYKRTGILPEMTDYGEPIAPRPIMDDQGRVYRSKKHMETILEFEALVSIDIGPPITVVNDVNDEAPQPFKYIVSCEHGKGVPSLASLPKNVCACVGYCDKDDPTCACFKNANFILPYDSDEQLCLDLSEEVWECGPDCQCADECALRVIQNGRKVKVEIFRTPDRGWGIRAKENIPYGTFVGLYIGEIITAEESAERSARYEAAKISYLFDLDGNETDETPVLYCVDSYNSGNFTRFINHSCEPNINIMTAHVTSGNLDLHDLALFACQNILEGEELSFDYAGTPSVMQQLKAAELGEVVLSKWDFTCLCGTRSCRGAVGAMTD